MRIFAILIIMFVTGCATYKPTRWELPHGDSVVCKKFSQEECGLSLFECGDGGVLEFTCLPKAGYEGPADAVPAKGK